MRKLGITLFILLFTFTLVKAENKNSDKNAGVSRNNSIPNTDTTVKTTVLKNLDKIAGVVGNSIILQSDVESQYAQYLAQGNQPNPNIKCLVVQQLLTQKLLAQQAIIDSVIVKDEEVDNEVDKRMRNMTQRAGGQDKLEQFLGRSAIQYKDEIRPDIKEQMVAERMRQKITEKVSVTPYDIEKYFNAIPKDSLPTYNKEIQVGEISFAPQLTSEEKKQYKDKAEALRTRVKNGEDFGNLARLYSQDPGSAPDGGDLGFADRSTFVKEFAATAFKLKAGEISSVFETDFGFHFLQVIERRGEQVHVRHILIRPEFTQTSLDRAKSKADSIYKLLSDNKKIDFSTAASFYSDSKETKYNGGMMLNADNVQSRTTYIPTDKLDPQIALITDTMKVGELSKPAIFTPQGGGKVNYKILYLKSKTDAHKANLAQDLPKIKEVAYEDKLNRSVSEWFEKKRKDTYVRIDAEYQQCPQLKVWVKNNPIASQTK